MRLPNEAALKVSCPFYEMMALAPKAFKLGELQDASNTKIVIYKKKYTLMVLSNAHFSNFTSLW